MFLSAAHACSCTPALVLCAAIEARMASIPPAAATATLLLSLLNFNLGVEAGQLDAVLIIVPLLIQLRKTQWEEKTIRALSAIVLIVGLALFAERVLVGA